MNTSSTCTACATMCTCRGFLFFKSGNSTGNRLTSRKHWHPACDVTSVESRPTSASARGTGASASAFIASSSSLGKFAATSAGPIGGDGASVNAVTAFETNDANTATLPSFRSAAITPPWWFRSPASAARTRSVSSVTLAGTPLDSILNARSNSAMNSGCGSARNTSPS